jgi:trehalose/maltose transport system permease protein
MTGSTALRQPLGIKAATGLIVGLWTVVAAFPLLWIAVMSVKLPVDAFASNPFQVILGFETRDAIGGLSAIDLAAGALLLYAVWRLWPRRERHFLKSAMIAAALAVLLIALRPLPILHFLAQPFAGFTGEHYAAVWAEHKFYRQFVNSMIVTFGVVAISLTVGTLAGYGLARSRSNVAFWILIAALIFRALPHSVLVTGYLPVFIDSHEIFAPLWQWPATGWFFRLFGPEAPTLYGQPLAVIAVLVAINQPFTIWMLRSFFENIPAELDEAARVDGCSHFGAFRRVIIPVMWPGVVTTGLFSFLLAYNDYLVAALLLDAQSMTMVPAITQYFNRETTTTDQIEAVAAAVSIVAPLFLLVMVFQKQIVSGLTQGAVKG